MAQYNYEVKVNGQTYLCTTLKEAHALESGHLPLRRLVRPPVQMRQPVPLLQNPRMRAGTKGFAMPLGQYNDPRQKWFREIVQNSTGKGLGTTEIIFRTGEDGGVKHITAIDNGRGMTPEILLDKFLVSGGTTKGGDEVGGFGTAKELILWPWGRWAVVTKTKKGKVLCVMGVGDSYDYYEDGQGPFDIEEGYDAHGEPQAVIHRGSIIERQRGTLHPSEVGEPFSAGESGTYIQVWGDKNAPPQAVDAFAFLPYCTLPNVSVKVDGKRLTMDYKPPTIGRGVVRKKIPSPVESWVTGALYFQPRGDAFDDGGGVVLVRAGGMLTWKAPFHQGVFLVEIIGDTKTILNAQRDSWKYSQFDSWINSLNTKVEHDRGSIGREVTSTTFEREYEGATSTGWTETSEAVADRVWEETQKAAESAKKIKDEKARKEAEWQVANEAAEAVRQQQEQQQQEDEQESRRDDEEDQRRRSQGGGVKAPKYEQEQREERSAKRIERSLGRSSAKVTEDILAQSAQGAWGEKLKLAAWAPPLRISNTIEGWRLTAEFKPATMSAKNLTILKVWTALIRRILGVLGCFDHKFGVGFILSSERLAQAGYGKKINVCFYQINPYISKIETRSGELPKSWVNQAASIEASAADSIQIDPYQPRHVAIMAGRALHEIVHGVYGVEGHNEKFSAVLTSLISAVGDKMGDIIQSGIDATADERAAAPRTSTPSGRATPVRVAQVAGRDPRLPPAGTVLERRGNEYGRSFTLRVVVGVGNEVFVSKPHYYDQPSTINGTPLRGGRYESLSAAVRAYLEQKTYNGFQYFNLKGDDKPCKYCIGEASGEPSEWESGDFFILSDD